MVRYHAAMTIEGQVSQICIEVVRNFSVIPCLGMELNYHCDREGDLREFKSLKTLFVTP
jgi:hypothetical protein